MVEYQRLWHEAARERDEAKAYAEEVEKRLGLEAGLLVEQRESLRAALNRIRAAAESDADLEKLPGLKGFLLTETKAVEHPTEIIGHEPEADLVGGGGFVDMLRDLPGHDFEVPSHPSILSTEEATAIVSAAHGEDHHVPTLDAVLSRLGAWIDKVVETAPQHHAEPCAKDSDWCDGVACIENGVECPNADQHHAEQPEQGGEAAK